jgi:GxxExxY protein
MQRRRGGGCYIIPDENRLNDLSGRVIGCAFTVLNTLGVGFLEKVYENALAHELRKAGLTVAQQHCFSVIYDGVTVGEYVVDLMVEQALLVELKAARALDDAHHAQYLNDLKASGLRLGLLLNFGRPRLDHQTCGQPALTHGIGVFGVYLLFYLR